MKLDKHIAFQLLMNKEFWVQVVVRTFPELKSVRDIKQVEKGSRLFEEIQQMYAVLNSDHNKTYYITESVMDKLDMLKVKRDKEFGMREN